MLRGYLACKSRERYCPGLVNRRPTDASFRRGPESRIVNYEYGPEVEEFPDTGFRRYEGLG